MKEPINNHPVFQDSGGNYYSYSDELNDHIVWDNKEERWLPVTSSLIFGGGNVTKDDLINLFLNRPDLYDDIQNEVKNRK